MSSMKLVVEEVKASPTQIVSILDSLFESIRYTIDYSDGFSYGLAITVDLVKHED